MTREQIVNLRRGQAVRIKNFIGSGMTGYVDRVLITAKGRVLEVIGPFPTGRIWTDVSNVELVR
jgi:hypothetical protein